MRLPPAGSARTFAERVDAATASGTIARSSRLNPGVDEFARLFARSS
jgi:hypothetical protein